VRFKVHVVPLICRIPGGENDVDVVAPDKPNGFLERALIAFDRKLCNFYGRASEVGNREFFDAQDFPWVNAIEADWRKVRAELDALLPYAAHLPNFQDLSRDAAGGLSQDDGWKTFFFYAYGMKAVGNCRRCPETTKLLQQMPGMKTAFFSILAPGKHLPPHRGIYKGVLRLHLGLLIPEPAEMCAIRVGSQTRHWQEGRVMIFDDVFQHEAWNRTDGLRVVLFVDIMRPMRFPANMLNAAIAWAIAFSPIVLRAAGNQLRWEKRFEAVVNQGPGQSRI
jgi:ornithine lipid ester-linked acyl 2-hydroxylase